VINFGEAIFTKDKPLQVSVRTLTNATNTSRNTGRRVKSPICIYIKLVLCQFTGILNSKEKMGRMKRLALAIVLACVLSGVARAGEIHTTGAVAPPRPPHPITAAGEIHSTGATAPESSSTLLTIILTLLDIVR
jgi:hypothetical protein